MMPADLDADEVAAFLEVLVEINKGRTWSRKNRVAKSWQITCPKCNGVMSLYQAASNGHVQGACETPGCTRFLE